MKHAERKNIATIIANFAIVDIVKIAKVANINIAPTFVIFQVATKNLKLLMTVDAMSTIHFLVDVDVIVIAIVTGKLKRRML